MPRKRSARTCRVRSNTHSSLSPSRSSNWLPKLRKRWCSDKRLHVRVRAATTIAKLTAYRRGRQGAVGTALPALQTCGDFSPYKSDAACLLYLRHDAGKGNRDVLPSFFGCACCHGCSVGACCGRRECPRRWRLFRREPGRAYVLGTAGDAHRSKHGGTDSTYSDSARRRRNNWPSAEPSLVRRRAARWPCCGLSWRRPVRTIVRERLSRWDGWLCIRRGVDFANSPDCDRCEAFVRLVAAQKFGRTGVCSGASRHGTFLQRARWRVRHGNGDRRAADARKIRLRYV